MNFRVAADGIGADNRGWVQLHVSTGGVTQKGSQKFEVTPDDIAAYATYIKANPDRIPIDYDHSFDKNGSSRAAGWVDASTVEVRNGDELWAIADWTPAAAQAIKDGEYRYISPEFTFQKVKDGVMRGAAKFIAATLTNRPFLKTMAPVRLDDDAKPDPPGGNMKDIALSLGLAEDADEKAILAALVARDEKVTAAETAAAEAKTALDAAKLELDTLKATASDGDKKVAELETTVAGLLKDGHETKCKALFADAIRDDRMLPAEQDSLKAIADKAGLEAVEALLSARPKGSIGKPIGSSQAGAGYDNHTGGGGAWRAADADELDPVTADLNARVQAYLVSMKLDRTPTQDDYLRAVAAVNGQSA